MYPIRLKNIQRFKAEVVAKPAAKKAAPAKKAAVKKPAARTAVKSKKV